MSRKKVKDLIPQQKKDIKVWRERNKIWLSEIKLSKMIMRNWKTKFKLSKKINLNLNKKRNLDMKNSNLRYILLTSKKSKIRSEMQSFFPTCLKSKISMTLVLAQNPKQILAKSSRAIKANSLINLQEAFSTLWTVCCYETKKWPINC